MKLIRILFVLLLCTPAFAEDTDETSTIASSSRTQTFETGFKKLVLVNDTGGAVAFILSASANGVGDLMSAYPDSNDFNYMKTIFIHLNDGEETAVYLRGLSAICIDRLSPLPEAALWGLKTLDAEYESFNLSLSIVEDSEQTNPVGDLVYPTTAGSLKDGQFVEVSGDVSKFEKFAVLITREGDQFELTQPTPFT